MTRSPGPFTTADCAAVLARVHERAPLVHNITNFVAMTVSANALLAIGASPAMVHAAEEATDFARIADALVVNIGTLSPPWVEAMLLAIGAMNAGGKPWVLDPVGCGATPYRTCVATELAALGPAVIRGNGSEIMALAGAAGAKTKGVDSTARSDDALAAASALAERSGAVVAVTGKTDYATDGTRVVAIEGGHPLMPRSTALGCALSAVTGAFATAAPPLEATVAALAVFGAAGAVAGSRCRGPGHMPAEICDALHLMDEATLERHAHVLMELV